MDERIVPLAYHLLYRQILYVLVMIENFGNIATLTTINTLHLTYPTLHPF